MLSSSLAGFQSTLITDAFPKNVDFLRVLHSTTFAAGPSLKRCEGLIEIRVSILGIYTISLLTLDNRALSKNFYGFRFCRSSNFFVGADFWMCSRCLCGALNILSLCYLTA
jgi:hypothetical protein